MRLTTDGRHRGLALGVASVTLLSAALLSPACSSENEASDAPVPMTLAQMRDPKQCASCHPGQFAQWSISMHAYAAEDPVFLAMNARAQRETGGEIGTFCVQCHAPMAVRLGLTKDGLNLPDLPAEARGVTCFSCHAAERVDAQHNNGIALAEDGVMRAGIRNPRPSPHGSQFSPLHARDSISSSNLCGSCHDIRTGHGVEVATTFAEWKGTIYSEDQNGVRLTCGNCHMPATPGYAASVDGAPQRMVHDHAMPGVDVPLSAFPGRSAMQTRVQENLDPSLAVKLCVKPPHGEANVEVSLDNAFVGHAFPSGASYDRRVWVELVAYEQGEIVYQSGAVADGTDVTSSGSPDLWLLRRQLFDEHGEETHFLWNARSSIASFLPPAVTRDPSDPAYYHAVTRGYFVPSTADRIMVRVRYVPVAFDIIDDLIASGDLAPEVRGEIPTFTLGGSVLEWTASDGLGCLPR